MDKSEHPQKISWHAQKYLRFLSLSNPQQRLGTWLILSVGIYLAKFEWLQNLSLLKAIGWESAPTVGLTRAYWLVLHGKFEEALAMNSLIVAVLVIGIPLLVWDVAKLARKT